MQEKRGIPHEEIARAAYLLWEKDGRPEGMAKEHWRKAEAALRKKLAAKPGPALGKKKRASSPRKKSATAQLPVKKAASSKTVAKKSGSRKKSAPKKSRRKTALAQKGRKKPTRTNRARKSSSA